MVLGKVNHELNDEDFVGSDFGENKLCSYSSQSLGSFDSDGCDDLDNDMAYLLRNPKLERSEVDKIAKSIGRKFDSSVTNARKQLNDEVSRLKREFDYGDFKERYQKESKSDN